jgi:secreted Zn-dependent insulinase-like peptidase
MPDDVFASYKQGLIATLTERDRNLAERGQRLWSNLELDVTTFDLRQQIADQVSRLTKDQIVDYLTRTAARFDDDRLLVYSNGRFEDAPLGGEPLGSVREFKGAG